MKRFLKTALALLLVLALAIPAWAAAPAEGMVYYAQLSGLSQTIFNALIDLGYTDGTITFNGPFSNAQQYAQSIAAAEPAALAALQLEHPEFFWINGASANINGNSSQLVMSISYKIAYNWWAGGRNLGTDKAALSAAVQQVAAEARAQGGAYAQLRYVHDWLTTHNEYNSPAAAAGADYDYLPWTPLSALTDAGQPVCQGYSKAFKVVCDELGIPCILVDGWGNGEPHEWNYVQLDGQWYGVDVTWDDPVVNGVSGNVSGYEKYEYFLVGSSSGFLTKHTTGGAHVDNVVFDTPTLAYDNYAGGGASEWPTEPEEPVEPDEPDDPDLPDEPGEDEEPQPLVFADVPEYAYYAPAVEWAVICGVTNGTKINDENGLNWFSPAATVTRGQAVTFLWRANWCPEPEMTDNIFSDVAAGSYYEQAVLWAIENGITNGTKWDEANGIYEFSPEATVTRGQMLTFLWRSLGKPGETEPYEGKPWNADAERWGDENGCIYGTAEPYNTASECPRADVVYYLWQAILSMAG